MRAFLRGVSRRQQHIGYFVICFLLFALAVALAKPVGSWAVIALWIALVGVLELVYRSTVDLVNRNRRTWWAKPRSRNYWFVFRWALYLGIAFAVLMVRHPYFRYAFLALVVAGLLSAVIIRWMGRRDQT